MAKPKHERRADAQALRMPPWVAVLLGLGLMAFAASPILVRYAGEAPGVAIAAWRTVLAALLLVPFVAARPQTRKELRWLLASRRDALLVLAAGALLGLHFVAWIYSLYYTSVAAASTLVTMTPVFLAVLGYVLLRERLTRGGVLGIAVAVGGTLLIGLGGAGKAPTPNALLGNSLALSAALLMSFYLLIGRVLRARLSWLGYVFPLYAVAALVALVGAWAVDVPLFGYSAGFYLVCLSIALGPQLLGHGSFNLAIKYLPAALLGVLSLLEPVGAFGLAYLLFDEAPGWWGVGGMAVVLVGVATVVLSERRR